MLGQLFTYIKKRLAMFAGDERGIGAVEFAFVFPILIVLYICAFELTVAFSVYKRTTNAAGTIADYVAQQQNVDKAFLQSTTHLAAAIFAPYSTRDLKLKVTGIQVDKSGAAKDRWSWDEANGRPYAVGSEVSLPSAMLTPDRFFVRAEVEIPHSMLRFMTTLDKPIQPFTLRNDELYEKRQNEAITCTGC